MRYTKSSDQSVAHIRAIAHGDSGIGKTTSLGTLPQNETVIAITERAPLPLRNSDFALVWPEAWGDFTPLIKDLSHPAAFTEKLRAEGVLPKGFTKLTTFALDSLSAASALCMRHILTKERPALIGERTEGKAKKPKGIYSDQMTMEDLGLYRTKMTRLLTLLCRLPLDIVVTALSAWTEDKTTKAIYRTPNLGGKLALEAPAHFDLVFHMETVTDADGKSRRVWRTANNGQVIAKDASGVLDELEKPDWQSVCAKIRVTKAGV